MGGRLIDADKLKKHYAWWGDFDHLRETKKDFDTIVDLQPTVETRLIDADKLIELIDDDIASLNKDMSREGYDVCLCTLQMVKQYIETLPTVPLDWKSVMDDWTEHDNAMIAKGREIERRLNAPKNGRWLKTGQSLVYPDKFRNYFCSVCGFELDTHIRQEPHYCPNCGADMREVESDIDENWYSDEYRRIGEDERDEVEE